MNISEITREIRASSGKVSPSSARFLVDSYYQVQKYRIGCDNQQRSDDPDNPATVYIADQLRELENQIKRLLDAYSDTTAVGKWSKSVCGIGPVIAAGLMAHIDIEQAPTVGHIWRFAGLDPTCSWEKKEKRPWNARLKTLCWKIGESFVKVSGRESDVYGQVYLARKALEVERNEAGLFAGQAAMMLEKKKIGKDTEAYASYSTGKLPPGHIHARAKRYAAKLFLSHWHDVAYRERFGTPPPLPYPIAMIPGHTHKIEPPE